ncbi:hypothetical protein JY430_13325 [Stenotrophomonas maltophilia]|nr:hypothetical protein [Stenotrophomonas maltophilia]
MSHRINCVEKAKLGGRRIPTGTSGLTIQLYDVPLDSHHPQLHSIALVADHAFDAQLHSDPVNLSRVQKNVVDAAGDGQQESVALYHPSHRSAVATGLHWQCGVVGVRQFTCLVQDMKEPVLVSPESRSPIGSAFCGIERSGYSTRRGDPSRHGLLPGGEVSACVHLFQEYSLPCRIDQAHGLPQVRRAAVLTSHRHKPKRTLALVHTVPLPESSCRHYSTQGVQP